MTNARDPLTAVEEFPGDDPGYAWWRNTHPAGYILAVRARHPPIVHRAGCRDVDRDAHPGRLRAAGSRQLCAETKPALRAWAGREVPGHGITLDRCPKCAP